MNKITGLVLTGGGAKAAYQAGALAALAEILPQKTTPFKVISGTSAGAINAAFVAASAEDWTGGTALLRERWNHLTLDKVYRTDGRSLFKIALGWLSRTLLGGRLATRSSSNYLLDTAPLGEMLKNDVDFARIRRNIETGILRAVSFTTTQYFSATSISYFDGVPEVEQWKRTNRLGIRTDLGYQHVLASSAIPVFFPPVEIKEKFYGDGSLRQTTPLSAAIHLGADRILSIGIRHERKQDEGLDKAIKPQPMAPSLAQITGELMNSIFMDSMDFDVERLERINQTVKMIKENESPHLTTSLKQIHHMHLRPSRELQTLMPRVISKFPPLMRFLLKGLGASSHQGNDLLGYLAFLPECSQPLMALGYEDTMKKKNQIIEFCS